MTGSNEAEVTLYGRNLEEDTIMKSIFVGHSSVYSITHILTFNTYLLSHFSANFHDGIIAYIQTNYSFSLSVNRFLDIITLVLTADTCSRKTMVNFLKCGTS